MEFLTSPGVSVAGCYCALADKADMIPRRCLYFIEIQSPVALRHKLALHDVDRAGKHTHCFDTRVRPYGRIYATH